MRRNQTQRKAMRNQILFFTGIYAWGIFRVCAGCACACLYAAVYCVSPNFFFVGRWRPENQIGNPNVLHFIFFLIYCCHEPRPLLRSREASQYVANYCACKKHRHTHRTHTSPLPSQKSHKNPREKFGERRQNICWDDCNRSKGSYR